MIGRRGEMQDFLCMCFANDSPPLRYYSHEEGMLVEAEADETDHSAGRVLVGTRGGDIYVFEQARALGGGQGGGLDGYEEEEVVVRGIKWWEAEDVPDAYERPQWQPKGVLVGSVPRNAEAGR